MGTKINLEGQTFGKLKVINQGSPDIHGNVNWLCLCECGNEVSVRGYSLKSGHTKSCGCYKKEMSKKRITKKNTTHGLSKSSLYGIYHHMKERCLCKTNKDYKYYGDRGISICEEWLNSFSTFYEWAIANGYEPGLTIDRINVNGNYEPENCRWQTRKQQANNKRNTLQITYNNETHTISEWSEITGLKGATIKQRIYVRGWDVEKALTMPVRERRREKK